MGNATRGAIDPLLPGVRPTLAGGTDEHSNGNGSLLRILPVALYFGQASMRDLLQAAHEALELTHPHPRSQIAYGIDCMLFSEIMRGPTSMDTYHRAIELASANYKKNAPFSAGLKHFERFLSEETPQLPED